MKDWKKRMNYPGIVLFLIVVGAALLSAVFLLLDNGPVTFERNSYGEGDKEESLYLDGEEIFQFTVKEKEYTKEELSKAFDDGFRWARKNMLGENASASEIRTDLNFMSCVPGGIQAEWIPGNTDLIRTDGTVCNDGWDREDSKTAAVQLVLSYREEVQMEQVYLRIKGPVLSRRQQLLEKVKKYVEQKEYETRQEDSFTLPDKVYGVSLSGKAPVNGAGILIVSLAVVLLLAFYRQNRQKEGMRRKTRQMLEDYPDLVNKLVLYLGAGVNLKAAFSLISEEYQEDKRQGQTEKRYVYEELFVMINEISAGVGEKDAYEAFAERTGEIKYIKFMSLLIQNLQKGSEGLLTALSSEEESAFLERIDRAKKSGEEAGTKLLFPMLLLLTVVMLMVMAPAIFQFQSY